MPVDKCGRNSDRTTTVHTGINIANLTNRFLWRDGVIPQLKLRYE